MLLRPYGRIAHTCNVTSTQTMRLGPIIPLFGTDKRDSYDLYNTVGPVINCLWSLSGSLSNKVLHICQFKVFFGNTHLKHTGLCILQK